jgi:uncharacterized membrane protein YdbT with pleckstrin-like domain
LKFYTAAAPPTSQNGIECLRFKAIDISRIQSLDMRHLGIVKAALHWIMLRVKTLGKN